MNKKLNSFETKLIGNWLKQGDHLIGDDVSIRIEYLVTNVLTRITSSDDGWNVLYIDSEDSRYWELSYPIDEVHGGGAPMLEVLSSLDVNKKYNIGIPSTGR